MIFNTTFCRSLAIMQSSYRRVVKSLLGHRFCITPTLNVAFRATPDSEPIFSPAGELTSDVGDIESTVTLQRPNVFEASLPT